MIDFNEVSREHEKINARLHNWARWAIGKGSVNVHPMFRHYRPDNYEREMGEPIDALDAQAVQKGVSLLPVNHALAISWCYVHPGTPGKMARKLGQSLQGLFVLIVDGRQMLINRRV